MAEMSRAVTADNLATGTWNMTNILSWFGCRSVNETEPPEVEESPCALHKMVKNMLRVVKMWQNNALTNPRRSHMLHPVRRF